MVDLIARPQLGVSRRAGQTSHLVRAVAGVRGRMDAAPSRAAEVAGLPEADRSPTEVATGSLAGSPRRRQPAGGADDERDDRGSMGAEAEFTVLYQARFGDLAAQLYAYTGDTGEAQEVVQEAFLRAWQRWQQIGRYDDPVAWVRRVAWNLATSRHRKVAVFRRFAAKIATPDHDQPVGPERVALVHALRRIPEQHRRALVLHYLADLSVADIALEVSVAEGTVKSWLHRGRAELARLLTDDHPFPADAAAPAVGSGNGRRTPDRSQPQRPVPAEPGTHQVARHQTSGGGATRA